MGRQCLVKRLLRRSHRLPVAFFLFYAGFLFFLLLLHNDSFFQLLQPLPRSLSTTMTGLPLLRPPPPPPPYSFLRRACRKAERPAECLSTLSAVPFAEVAGDGAAVMEVLRRHAIRLLEHSRSRLLSSLSNAGGVDPREALSECSDLVETGLRVLRIPGLTRVNPGPTEALNMASFYIFTCVRLVRDIEEGSRGPSLEGYVRSLLDGADHLCRVGSDFGYRNGFGVGE